MAAPPNVILVGLPLADREIEQAFPPIQNT